MSYRIEKTHDGAVIADGFATYLAAHAFMLGLKRSAMGLRITEATR